MTETPISLAILREFAEGDGESQTEVIIGGLRWDVVLALVEAVSAAQAVVADPEDWVAVAGLKYALSRFVSEQTPNGGRR